MIGAFCPHHELNSLHGDTNFVCEREREKKNYATKEEIEITENTEPMQFSGSLGERTSMR